MNRQEIMDLLLQEARKGGTYHGVKKRVLDQMTKDLVLPVKELLDKIQELNEAQLLLNTQGRLSVDQTYGGQIVFVVYDQCQAADI